MLEEMQIRMTTADSANIIFNKISKRKLVSHTTKYRIYTMYVARCEIGQQNLLHVSNLLSDLQEIFESKVLRRIVGPACDNIMWRQRKTGNFMHLLRILTLHLTAEFSDRASRAHQVECNLRGLRTDGVWSSAQKYAYTIMHYYAYYVESTTVFICKNKIYYCNKTVISTVLQI